MDIQVNPNDFQNFLKKCSCNDLIKDLVIQADEKGLMARFCTKEKTLYGEVYLPDITVNADGVLKIPRVKQLISSVSRFNSELVRIITKEPSDGSTPEYCITDGVGINKIKTNLLQTSDAVVVESYDSLSNGKMFDTQTLEYLGQFQYENGCKVDYDMLVEVLKDAKAFGYEVYRFFTKTVKKKDQDPKTYLMCSIINEHTQESFNRTIAETNFIGDPAKIPEVYVGGGFRQIVTAIMSSITTVKVDENTEEKKKPIINMYFHEMSILLTDGKTFFFNVHTME